MTIQEEIEQLKGQISLASEDHNEAEIILELLKIYISIRSLDSNPFVNRLQQLADKMNSKPYQAWAACYLAATKLLMREYDSSLTLSRQALTMFEALKEEKGIVCVYCNIGATHFNQSNYNEALSNYLKAVKAGEEINDKFGIATACNNLGMIHRHQGNYREAMKYHLKALGLRQEISDIQGIAASYNNIGIVQKVMGHYPEALKSYLLALSTAEKIEHKKVLADSYINIGLIHENMKNYSQALESFHCALRLRQNMGDNSGVAQAYNNIGLVHIRKLNYKDGLKFHLQALYIYKKLESQPSIANAFTNTAFAYFKQGNFDEALKNQSEALEICKAIGDAGGSAIGYNNMGGMYREQGKYQEAIDCNLQALEIANGIGLKRTIIDVYLSLARTYKAIGDFETALKYHEKYHQIENEILGEETQKQLTNLNFQHNMEQKEKELEIQKLKNIEFETILDKMKLTAIRAQLEPHFIGNALASIQSYIREQPEIAESYLTKFSRLMFDVLVKFKEDFISLEDELSILRDYMDLEALRRNHGFEYKIKVAPSVEVETMQVPPLILQPIVENAIKHGMAKGDKKGLIKLDIKLNKKMLICNVENTIFAVAENDTQKEKRKSFGLQIIRDRLDILSKEKREKGFLELIPMKNKMKVQLGIPI